MKFRIGKPPINENVNVTEWIPVKEPKNIWVTQILSMPIGLITAGLIFFISYYFKGIKLPKPILIYPFAIFLVILLHELIHAMCFPGSIFSENTVIGYWPEAGVYYVHSNEALKRNRYLLVYVAPFFILSVIPTIIMLFLNFIRNDLILLIALLNAIGSCVDIFFTILVLLQVPKEAILVNSEEKTYWKPINC
ncbi:DUF3267 domain-containing protein [Caldicellulosiruptor morganii]|uniref:DUF3267 domain-containing protein n=1 Tax=Caldicellulosiruptor morganii TaxID=1387555 RepID=A0ABY7BJX6_9FIRM|nr:DUF3267 domain-containing protein [Caldicellulosiruptor morganii]WAM32795.1 DUF3267 domain-containing protein [Caldicellulosiruptor morganii]